MTEEELNKLIEKLREHLLGKELLDSDRTNIIDKIMKGYCEHCGRIDLEGDCRCWDDS